MLNLDEMVNLHPVQIRLSLEVKVHPVESSNMNGSKGLGRIPSKFRVRISAGWWKNDDKGINPKVNLDIYYTWVPLMFRRCPWCKTLRNLVGLVVHETKTGPTGMIPLHLTRPHHNNNVKQSGFYIPRQKRLMIDSDNNSAESVRKREEAGFKGQWHLLELQLEPQEGGASLNANGRWVKSWRRLNIRCNSEGSQQPPLASNHKEQVCLSLIERSSSREPESFTSAENGARGGSCRHWNELFHISFIRSAPSGLSNEECSFPTEQTLTITCIFIVKRQHAAAVVSSFELVCCYMRCVRGI